MRAVIFETPNAVFEFDQKVKRNGRKIDRMVEILSTRAVSLSISLFGIYDKIITIPIRYPVFSFLSI